MNKETFDIILIIVALLVIGVCFGCVSIQLIVDKINSLTLKKFLKGLMNSKEILKDFVIWIENFSEELHQEKKKKSDCIGTFSQWEEITENITHVKIPSMPFNVNIRFGSYIAENTPTLITFTSSETHRFVKFLHLFQGIRLSLISKINSDYPNQMTCSEIRDLVNYLLSIKQEEDGSEMKEGRVTKMEGGSS